MTFQSKSEYIFGAYTPCKWEHYSGGCFDDTFSSFIFSQTHDQVHPLRQNINEYAIQTNSNGLIFGNGYDIMIQENFIDGYSRLGKTYEFDQYKGDEDNPYLFGSIKPEIIECEIYQLQFI